MAFGICFPFDMIDVGAGDAIGVNNCEVRDNDEANGGLGAEENVSMDCKVDDGK